MSQFADEIQSEMLAEKDAEITRLRAENERLRTIGRWNTDRVCADLAAVTAERDRMREALKPLAALLETDDETYSRIVGSPLLSDLHRARAAIEGVTEPANTQTGER